MQKIILQKYVLGSESKLPVIGTHPTIHSVLSWYFPHRAKQLWVKFQFLSATRRSWSEASFQHSTKFEHNWSQFHYCHHKKPSNIDYCNKRNRLLLLTQNTLWMNEGLTLLSWFTHELLAVWNLWHEIANVQVVW